MTTPSDNTSVVEASGLFKFFRQTAAVSGVTLNLSQGTVFGLIGPNGAGKSTLIKMLMGMLRPTNGNVWIFGTDVLLDPVAVRQRVGYVPETHTICRWMRVEEVLGFCRSVFDVWNESRCRDLLDLFGLDRRKKVKHLSKGMQVKLSLLLAVCHDPELLILDEPMAGLDPISRDELLEGVLRSICQRQCTVIFSTHTLSDVQRLADTVGILYEGKMLLRSGIDDLLTTTKRIRATLPDDSIPTQIPEDIIWHRADGRQWLATIRNFTPEKVDQLRGAYHLQHVEVVDLGLEDLFKDFIKGQRAAS